MSLITLERETTSTLTDVEANSKFGPRVPLKITTGPQKEETYIARFTIYRVRFMHEFALL